MDRGQLRGVLNSASDGETPGVDKVAVPLGDNRGSTIWSL